MEVVARANLIAAVLKRQLPKRGYKGSFIRKEKSPACLAGRD